MNRLEIRLAVAFLMVGLAGCTASPRQGAPSSETASSPFQRTVGPDFSASAPDRPPLKIDAAMVGRDRRTAWASFIGGPAYRSDDPCSKDYEAWSGMAGDVLELQIDEIDHPEQATTASDMACPASGRYYLVRFLLPAPFAGSTVRDRASGVLWIPPVDQVAELPALPPSWQLTVVHTPGSVLWRDYEPGPEVAAGTSSLGLFQTFGGPPEQTVDAPISTVSIRGQDVPIGRNGDAGYIASWRLGTDGMSLVSLGDAFTQEQFVALANAVSVPAP